MKAENNMEKAGTQEGSSSPDQTPAPPPKQSSSVMVWVSLLLSLIAIGAGVVTYRQMTTLRTDTTVADQLQQRDGRINALQDKLASLGALLTDTQTGMNRLEQSQARNADTLRSLAGNMRDTSNELAVAEVELLLIMAIHKLTLERDVNTALAALEAADRRLADLDEPGLYNTRSQLAADMNSLRAVNQVDTAGLSLYLADIIGRVAALPLNRVPVLDTDMTRPTDDTLVPAWQRLLQAVWQEFRSMFVVTRAGSSARATLLPDETWFLYQNLRLQLESARLAVVRRDTENLRTSIQLVTMWLNDYFDTGDSSVANILQTADKMAGLDLDPVLPDISSSLETLHAFIKAGDAETGIQ